MMTCVFCGASATDMDMTGHGWRCRPCSTRAEIDALRHGAGAGLDQHLTPVELDRVIGRTTTEVAIGILMLVGGLALIAASIAGAGALITLGVSVLAVGVGVTGHGAYTRGQAITARRRLRARRGA